MTASPLTLFDAVTTGLDLEHSGVTDSWQPFAAVLPLAAGVRPPDRPAGVGPLKRGM